jgi:hypothetical protein
VSVLDFASVNAPEMIPYNALASALLKFGVLNQSSLEHYRNRSVQNARVSRSASKSSI